MWCHVVAVDFAFTAVSRVLLLLAVLLLYFFCVCVCLFLFCVSVPGKFLDGIFTVLLSAPVAFFSGSSVLRCLCREEGDIYDESGCR